jgi:hypothetical protein
MVDAFDVDHERDGLTAGARVIVAEDFDEATVTADALFGNDEAIGRLVFGTEALEADAKHCSWEEGGSCRTLGLAKRGMWKDAGGKGGVKPAGGVFRKNFQSLRGDLKRLYAG